MADNSKYTLGTDLYQGNRITSWPELAKWAGFVYFRASIGARKDTKFVEYTCLANDAGMAIGAYHELWPNLNVAGQVRLFAGAIYEAEIAGATFSLPPAVIYEPQPLLINFKKVSTLPNPTDLVEAMRLFPGAIIGTNLAGLYALKNESTLLHTHKYWIAHYLSDQTQGEMSVEHTLTELKGIYHIDPQQVLFVQTGSKQKYPKGVSPDKEADTNRAVTFHFEPNPVPAPVPVPVPVPAPIPVPEPRRISQVIIVYSDGYREVIQ